MDIQIKPIVTEKATAYSEKQNCYTFAVSPDANKFQIKDVVEKALQCARRESEYSPLCRQAQTALHQRRAYQLPETFIQEGIRDRCRRTNDRLL